jgi:hypothetical protein
LPSRPYSLSVVDVLAVEEGTKRYEMLMKWAKKKQTRNPLV